MLLGFALGDLFLLIDLGFRIPLGLRERNEVKDTIEVSIPLVILYVPLNLAGAFLLGSNAGILQKLAHRPKPFNRYGSDSPKLASF